MTQSEQINRLQRRLTREASAPLVYLSNRMTASLFSLLRSLAEWVREATLERPLVSLVVACEAGFVVGRLGRSHAKR